MELKKKKYPAPQKEWCSSKERSHVFHIKEQFSMQLK